MMTTTYTYRQVTAYGSKNGVCAVCGGSAKRAKRFRNTVNPFNRNPDGTVRTYDEVYTMVKSMAAEWEAEPLVHKRCEGA